MTPAAGTARAHRTPTGLEQLRRRGLPTTSRQISTPPDNARSSGPMKVSAPRPTMLLTLLPTMSLTSHQRQAHRHRQRQRTAMPTVPLASAQRNVRLFAQPIPRPRCTICPAHKASRSAKRLSTIHPSSQSGPRSQSGRKSSRVGSGRARIGFGWQFAPPYYENKVNTQ